MANKLKRRWARHVTYREMLVDGVIGIANGDNRASSKTDCAGTTEFGTMARRKREEEHENHERWLVSYADFITLLFAFFVVMYALSSINEGSTVFSRTR